MKDINYCKASRVIQTHRIFPFDLNPFGFLFGGTLMTLIDDTASISVSQHCRHGAVTASLDNLNFLEPLHANHSVRVESFVSGVHKRSLEVFVKVVGENLSTGERYLAATCFTTFVVVPSDLEGDKVLTVPRVIPETDEEKMVCSGYEKRRAHRLSERDEYKNFAKKLSLEVPWTEA